MGEYDDLIAWGQKGPAAAPAAVAPSPADGGEYADLMAWGKPQVSRKESAAQGFVQGGSFGFADEAQAALDTVASKIPGLRTIAQKSREFTRQYLPASDTLPVDDPNITYQQRRDYMRAKAKGAQEANPGTYLAGALGSAVLPVGAAAAGKGLVQAVKAGAKTGAVLGGASGLGGSEANLLSGEALEALRDTASGALFGGAVGAGAGAAGHGLRKFIEGARSRVVDRTAQDIKRGETVAKQRTANKVTERSGEANEELADLMSRDPRLGKLLALKAGSSPDRAAAAVETKAGEVTDELNTMYTAMEKADRLVKPQEILDSFTTMIGKKLKAGDMDAVRALRKTRDEFASEYGNFGALGADTMRGLKRTAGRAGFAGDPAAPASAKAQVAADVWKVFSEAIEKQAEGSGVDVAKLRQLNRDASLLIPIEQALTERATKEAAGTLSMQELFKRFAAPGIASTVGGIVGYDVGGTEGALIGASLGGARRLGRAAVRRGDYALSQMGGAAPNVSAAYAARVAQGLKQGMSLKDAAKAAEE